MKTYKEFFEFCEKVGYKFKQPIKVETKDCFSSDLKYLLSIHNGEDENTEYVFRRTYSNQFIQYQFLDWNTIKRITKEINSNPVFTDKVSSELLHFAMARKSSDNNHEYGSTFAISETNEIYKCNFTEYDRFNLVRDIGQVRFSSNMKEFLETQKQLITWDFQQNYKFR